MQVKIKDIKNGLISGVSVYLVEDAAPYREDFFQWEESPLIADFKTASISGGTLKAWHHKPVFTQVETHADKEMFYFVSGTAIMLFADIKDGAVVMESAQIVRIQEGTQIIIDAGKAHFVAVAEGDESVRAVVVAPKMPAPRIEIGESIEGIE